MVARKSVDAWLADLASPSPHKRMASARKLRELDATLARKTLLELLAQPERDDVSRATLGLHLHSVADEDTARRLLRGEVSDVVTLDCELLPIAARVALYHDFVRDLPALNAAEAEGRLEKLGVFRLGIEARQTSFQSAAEAALFKDSLLACLLAALDDGRLENAHPVVGRSVRVLDTSAGDRELVDRFAGAPSTRVRALDAYIAWARMGASTYPDGPSISTLGRLTTELIDQLRDLNDADARILPSLDGALAATVGAIPTEHLVPLAHASRPAMLPKFCRAIAERTVATRRDHFDDLVALCDDEGLRLAWPLAFAALVNGTFSDDPRRKIDDGACVALARSEHVPLDLLNAAVRRLTADHAYDVMMPRLVADRRLWSIVLQMPSLLDDARWLALAAETPTWHSEPTTRIVAIAANSEHTARDSALRCLVAVVKSSGSDVVSRRAALTRLGESGHPGAMPTLLAAFHDPQIGSAMALTLEAIGKCAGLDAIPVLEARINGPWKSSIEAAVAAIRRRAGAFSPMELLAASEGDGDPVLADLARRAREGDPDAFVVLEDALRERGRL